MIYEFDAELVKIEGKLHWTIFYIPFSVKEAFGINGRVYVKTFIDDYQLEGILLPSKNGHYMVFNKDFQNILKKKRGDTIHVKLELNDEIKTLRIPDIIIQKLKHNADLLQAFNALPHYIKKEEINKIMSAKKEDTRIQRLDSLIKKLLSSSQ